DRRARGRERGVLSRLPDALCACAGAIERRWSDVTSTTQAEMSVVIVTPDTYETIRKTMRHVRAQSARDRLEVVIVAPSAADVVLDDADTSGTFAAVRVVEA